MGTMQTMIQKTIQIIYTIAQQHDHIIYNSTICRTCGSLFQPARGVMWNHWVPAWKCGSVGGATFPRNTHSGTLKGRLASPTIFIALRSCVRRESCPSPRFAVTNSFVLKLLDIVHVSMIQTVRRVHCALQLHAAFSLS